MAITTPADAFDWSEFYQTFGRGFMGYLLSTGLQVHDAEDILQDSFLALWNHRDKILARETVCSYWFRIVKNKRADFYRKGKADVPLDDVIQIPDHPVSTENEDDLRYLRIRISKALAELPQEMAEAYSLAKISGFPLKRIAELQGTTEQNVKNRVFRARARLMESLEDVRKNE